MTYDEVEQQKEVMHATINRAVLAKVITGLQALRLRQQVEDKVRFHGAEHKPDYRFSFQFPSAQSKSRRSK
jgi:hypothetical protein